MVGYDALKYAKTLRPSISVVFGARSQTVASVGLSARSEAPQTALDAAAAIAKLMTSSALDFIVTSRA
jgi:hypothetical protein